MTDKPETASSLLSRAEVIARQAGDDELASKILNLRLFGDGDTCTKLPAIAGETPAVELPPFDPPYTVPAASAEDDPEAFRIPSGKYAGCYVRDLTTQQLHRVWAGYNGAGCSDIANKLKAALVKRARTNR